MNKLTKVGLSALCGSLAAISAAQAGEMTVTGSAMMTRTTSTKANTGNPLGMKTNLTFKGSGELDGGQTVTATVDHTDQNAFSAGNISLQTNNIGTFDINQAGGGNGVGGYDDKMPTAWEEVWDTGLASGADFTKGVGSSMNVQWTTPSVWGTKLKLAYAPRVGAGATNDKATSGDVGTELNNGVDIVLDIDPSLPIGGFNVFAGYSNQDVPNADRGANTEDRNHRKEEGVAGAIVTIGPIKAGLQKSVESFGNEGADEVNYYRNVSWGVSFNINDNLALSYGEFESQKNYVQQGDNEAVLLTSEALQLSYTIGGASIKIADAEVNNAKYSSDAANDKDGRTFALSLAF